MPLPANIRNQDYDRITLRHFWQIASANRRATALIMLIPANAFFLYTLLPFIVGKLLANLTHAGSNLSPYLIAFVIVGLAGLAANFFGYRAYMPWQAHAMSRLQTECLDMLLHRGTAFHNNQVSGKLVSDAVDYHNAFMQLSNAFITTIFPFATSVITGLIVIFISSPLLGAVMLVMSFVAIGSGVSFRRRMAPFRAQRIAANKDVISHTADTITNVHAVKTFAHEAQEMRTHAKLNKILTERRMHDWLEMANDGTKRIGYLLVFELAFIVLTITLVHHDPKLLAAGIFAFSYTITLTNRLFDIGSMMRSLEEAYQLAEPMTMAMQQAQEIVDVPGAKRLSAVEGTIAFNNVTFSYSDNAAHEPVFSDLTMEIPAGQKVGIVGPSGGGKSTITKLLLRFEDIQAGNITIDGKDIASVTQTSLRTNIAYVPQESLLFHRTIRDNIAYGNLAASDAAIVEAARQAHADEFITGLPNGYDTIVGERGIKLSGGQRQRIAIARAMLKNARILVLDEATSALDSESEKVIQDALWKLMQDRTAVVIAHRLSTIQKMDRIIVIEQGKIIEDGSHEALLKNKGLYARLWQRQSGGFLEA